MKTYLTYGIYNTLAFALLNLVLYFTGFQTEKLATGQYLNYIGTAIFLGLIFLGMREVRTERGEQGLSYGSALGAGTMIALFAGVLGAVYVFIHFAYINPEYPQYLESFMRTKFEAQKIPDSQIEGILKMQRVFLKPAIMAPLSILGTVFMGVLGSLILAIFVKRAPSVPPVVEG